MNSAHKEDYLRIIYYLLEKNQEAKSVDVAEYLNVTKPSVSEMLRNLDKDGLIQYKKYSKIKLTNKGFNLARNLTARHRIIESFLKDTLKINPQKIHYEANKLEHAFSDESIMKLSKLLKNPKTDPHGKPIPTFS
jgi:DtxR family Mn-dependent transcriptional regulator|tara:strand:- start:3396 stop:3800 length:405 start_codon:yes stop_codon:yes gene_type:complete